MVELSPDDPAAGLARRLSRMVEPVHSTTYYCREIDRLRNEGYRGWWHAYFAYRAAPMGPVTAPVVTATFYNFAPRMVNRAVPAVWEVMTPARVIERRAELVDGAFARIFGDGHLDATLADAAELARAAVADLDLGSRPLSAATAELPWPDGPAMTVWQACTIWREYRGDGHNIALAAAGIDGVEAHVLMAAHGHGNQPTITGIRGWTAEEWGAAADRLRERGLIDRRGDYTDRGRSFRTELERTTDRLSAAPVVSLGIERSQRLVELLGRVAGHLIETGEVPGVWPPPTVRIP